MREREKNGLSSSKMSEIEKNFMSRFDDLVALNQNQNVETSGNIPLSLSAVEEEQQKILDRAYGRNVNHVNYNLNIQSMRDQNAKMAASLGYISPPNKGKEQKQSSSPAHSETAVVSNENSSSSSKTTPTRFSPPVPLQSLTLSDPRDHQINVLRQTLVKERRASSRALERAFEREVFLKKQIDILRSSNDSSLLGVGDVELALDRMRQSSQAAIAESQERAEKAEKDVALMKKSLIKAKAYHLHTTMEKILLDSNKLEKKYKAMIGNLQAEKNLLSNKVSNLELKLRMCEKKNTDETD